MFLFVADNQPLMFCRNLRLLIKINYDHISRDKCYDVMSLLWLCYDNDNKTQLRRSPACCPGVAISSTNRKKMQLSDIYWGGRDSHTWAPGNSQSWGESSALWETMNHADILASFWVLKYLGSHVVEIFGLHVQLERDLDIWKYIHISAPFILMRKTWVIRSTRKGPF